MHLLGGGILAHTMDMKVVTDVVELAAMAVVSGSVDDD